MKVSFSALSTVLECEAKASYKYRDGLRPQKAATQFEPGSIFHEAIASILYAHAWSSNDVPVTLPYSVEVPSTVDAVRGACATLRDKKDMTVDAEEHADQVIKALDYHIPQMDLDNWETVWHDGKPAIELELEVEFFGETLIAHIDWIAKSKQTGKVWIIDHKTSKNRFSQQPWVEFDLQLALYREACLRAGIEADGSLLHQVCLYPPNTPRPLKRTAKDGRRFSIAKNQRTDWNTYLAALLEHGEDPEKYDDIRDMLLNQTERQPFRRWTPDVTTPEGHRRLMLSAELATRRLRQIRSPGYPALARRVNEWSCGRCEYRSYCDAMFATGDASGLIGTMYQLDDDSPLRGTESSDTGALQDMARRSANNGRWSMHGFVP